MVRGTIRVPQRVITGPFSLNISLQRDVEISPEDILFETVEGDPLGHNRDRFFSGDGANYSAYCYIEEQRQGISIVSLDTAGVNVLPQLIQYDTIRKVGVLWGAPVQRGNKLDIPFTLSEPVHLLRKRNFSFERNTPFQIYSLENNRHKVVCNSGTNKIIIKGNVRKSNGVEAILTESVLEI